MSDFEKLYTVEDIAKMTSFTTRTIRNYLKNGSLQGSKIGGQWRFTMENIKGLFDNSKFILDLKNNNNEQILNFIKGTDIDVKGKVQVCAIADYYCGSQKEGHKIYEKLVTVINSKDEKSPPAKFNYEFIEKSKKARFTLFGDPEYVIETLQLL